MYLTSSIPYRRRVRRRDILILGAVAGVHLLFYTLLTRSVSDSRTQKAPTRPALVILTLQWPSARRLDPAAPSESPTHDAAARPPRVSQSQPNFAPAVDPPVLRDVENPAPHNSPQAITLPRGQADAATPVEPPASQPPLNLTLRPGFATQPGARNPALDDPRVNTDRSASVDRMAATLGTDDRTTEENLGGGRRRIRRGNDCVIVSPSRVGELMPFNDAAVRSPSLISKCP